MSIILNEFLKIKIICVLWNFCLAKQLILMINNFNVRTFSKITNVQNNDYVFESNENLLRKLLVRI